MHVRLWLPVSITLAIGSAAVWVSALLRTETGRRRLFPGLRLIMRVMNPRIVRAVERGESPFGVLHHVGRRSGRRYDTPVAVGRTPDGVVVPLMYGPGTAWCHNILAAGECTLTFAGEDMVLTAPEVITPPVADAQLSAETLREWRGQGIAHYLSLKNASRQGIAEQRPGGQNT